MEALNKNNLNAFQNEACLDSCREELKDTNTKIKSRVKLNFYKAQRYFILCASIISSILILNVVLGYTEMVSINSSNKLVQGENEDLQLLVDSLELKLSPYISKERIEKIASNRLDMVYPDSTNIVMLEKEGKKVSYIDQEGQKEAEDKSILSFVNGLIR
ncbi:MAG: hypothetical protein Q4E50_00175 [Tissierellia bacterium]|nr:hypothetical protein [Tissierellia bacterium]